MLALYADLTSGVYDQPDLDAQGRISDYEAFARMILTTIRDRPISFEVFSDEFDEMERQAHRLRLGRERLCQNPITNTRGSLLTT